jgi:hypothetical protein
MIGTATSRRTGSTHGADERLGVDGLDRGLCEFELGPILLDPAAPSSPSRRSIVPWPILHYLSESWSGKSPETIRWL